MQQNKSPIKCSKQNEGAHLCARSQCKNSATMCDDKKCSCRQVHSLCLLNTSLADIKHLLSKKGRSYSKVFEEIYDWYNTLSKKIAIEMEELKKLINNQELYLKGDEEVLYEHLAEGKSSDVIPKLVNSVTSSIFKEPVYDLSDKIKELKKQLLKYDKQISTIFMKINNLSQAPNKSGFFNLKFDPEFCHPNIELLSDNKIAKLKKYPNFQLTAALIQFSPSETLISVRYKFKLRKVAANQIMVGVCQLKNVDYRNTYIYNKIQHGFFVFSGSPQTSLGSAAGHRVESNTLKVFTSGDDVEVEYWKENHKVEVRNLTKNTKSVVYIVVDKSQPMHFGVLLNSENDEAEAIEMEVK